MPSGKIKTKYFILVPDHIILDYPQRTRQYVLNIKLFTLVKNLIELQLLHKFSSKVPAFLCLLFAFILQIRQSSEWVILLLFSEAFW